LIFFDISIIFFYFFKTEKAIHRGGAFGENFGQHLPVAHQDTVRHWYVLPKIFTPSTGLPMAHYCQVSHCYLK
jgi:hypothetical protein